jgi:predicted transcriptional regulator
LGELEAAVLDVLWSSSSPLSVRDVLARIRRRPTPAYTTVLTVLDRLHEKRVVTREKDGKAFLYTPSVTKEVWFGEQAARVLAQATPTAHEGVLLAFIDGAERTDPQLLERLAALLAARRKERSS